MANKKPAKSQNATLKDLKAAPYNPRMISDENKKRLRKSIEKFGDLSGIIFNRTSGHLVGGHQRAKILPPDAAIEIITAYGKPTPTGTVAEGFVVIKGEKFSYREVEWDEQTEKAANVSANAQGGDWDEEKLSEIMKELADDPSFDIELTGYDLGDLNNVFGHNILDQQPERLLELSAELKAVEATQKKMKEKIKARDDTDFYVVAVFRTSAESTKFLTDLGLPDGRYVDGRLLRERLHL